MAVCECVTFLVDGPLRKERVIFKEIVGVLITEGVEFRRIDELQLLM